MATAAVWRPYSRWLPPGDPAFWPESLKGLFFVLFTGLLLHWLVKRDVDAIAAADRSAMRSHDQAIDSITRLMDTRHRETQDHTRRVTRMTVELARRHGGFDDAALKRIERGAMLHDIGKIGIPDAILTKAGPLDSEEWIVMRQHPVYAREFLSQVEFLRPVLDIPYSHHERWDGTGYPLGLAGEAIPLSARLFAVVDVWDALIHPRVYKSAWDERRVLDYLRDGAGTQFDPAVVRVFLGHYGAIKRAAQGPA